MSALELRWLYAADNVGALTRVGRENQHNGPCLKSSRPVAWKSIGFVIVGTVWYHAVNYSKP